MERQHDGGRHIRQEMCCGSGWGGAGGNNTCCKMDLGKIRGAWLLFVFIQLSGLDFNLQSDWELLKRINLGSDVILIAFLQNYCGQNVKDEWRTGETKDTEIATEMVILDELQKLVKVRENAVLS